MAHRLFFAVVAVVLTAAAVHNLAAQEEAALSTEPPFGSDVDVTYAMKLWEEMRAARLVGPESIEARPYEGSEPHGAILVTLQTEMEMAGNRGPVIVKKNYMGEGVSVQSVSDNPHLNLAAITVMYRREAGYDPDNQDWFWVKYGADGSVLTNPRGVRLAGRVAKNPEDACIACHRFAPGEDYVFLHDQYAASTRLAALIEEVPIARAVGGLAPIAEQPNPAALVPGLAVTYYYNIFNFVDEIPELARFQAGEAGDPILALDYNVGSGRVLTSRQQDGVGAMIRGLINFPEAGTYHLAMQSNDGVELSIGGHVIVSDPNVHADRFSELIPVEIAEPGWYPLDLLYFEKRNTSTLELYWSTPSEDEALEFVPAEAFAHLPT
ncbi:MAG: PA14 domain-containing protein [Alphaproteobacteria bacterium]